MSGGESSRPEESHDLASPRNNASGKEAMSLDIVLEGSDTTMDNISLTTPVQAVDNKGPSKLVLGINCNHPNKDKCPFSHCQEWIVGEEMSFQSAMLPGVVIKGDH